MRYAYLSAPCLQHPGLDETCLVQLPGTSALCARPAYPLLESTQCYTQISADPPTYQAWTEDLPHPVADLLMLAVFSIVVLGIGWQAFAGVLSRLLARPLPNPASGSIT